MIRLIILICVFVIVVYFFTTREKRRYMSFVINLEKNQDRLKRFMESYRASDMRKVKLERFDAINGKLLNLSEYVTKDAYQQILDTEYTGFRKHHYELTKGAVGCFLSHASLYEKLLKDTSHDYYVIFEDDAYVTTKMLSKMENIIENAPKDWDIILLGTIREVIEEKGMFYDKIRAWWGLYGYVINKRGAGKFMNVYRKGYIDKQIDSMFSLMTIENGLNVYSPHIHLVTHNGDGTDIQMPVKNDEFTNPYMYGNIELFFNGNNLNGSKYNSC